MPSQSGSVYASDPLPISPVQCAFNRLGASLSNCADLIAQLDEKIGPSLVHSPPSLAGGSEANTASPSTCALVDQINEVSRKVEAQVDRVRRMLNDCQL